MTNEQIMKWAAEAGISDWFLGTEDFQSGLQARRIEQLRKFGKLYCGNELSLCEEVVSDAYKEQMNLEEKWGDTENEYSAIVLGELLDKVQEIIRAVGK